VPTVSAKKAYEAERTEFLEGFAANVRRLREEHDPRLSQAALQDAANLHRTEIGRIEAGIVEPRLLTLVVLADALDVSLDQLVAGLGVPRERKPPPRPR
jgi:transcriptional regulator with XRE-family HTH domain